MRLGILIAGVVIVIIGIPIALSAEFDPPTCQVSGPCTGGTCEYNTFNCAEVPLYTGIGFMTVGIVLVILGILMKSDEQIIREANSGSRR
jgi:uncharacterized membrane protein